MSDEQEDKDLEAMRQLIEQQEAKERSEAATAAIDAPAPQPQDTPEAPVEAQAQEPQAPTPEPVTPTRSAPETPAQDDPVKWAQKKGLNSPEAIARSLQQMEQEFHKRNQQGHPGYQDLNPGQPAPQTPPQPPPNWNPNPQGFPPYGYPPPPPQRQDISRSLAQRYGMDPEDVERLMPMVVDAAEAIASRRTMALERQFADVQRQSARSSELMQLSQDPAFVDPRVQKEMHEVLKDGSIFQRERAPYAAAFNQAMQNLARKTLQQGAVPERTNQPPTTAGGGNGSANHAPMKITDAVFNSWTDAEQDTYMKSNGRILPKR